MHRLPQTRLALRPLWPILAIIALGSVAVRPILLGPALPCTDDAAFHLLRLTQLDHLLRQGILYSRWAPEMALGYGFPFFNFYAPLAYYAAALVSLVAGLHWGMRLTFALGILASGLGAYRLARDHFSRRAALLTAVAFMYAPYHGYDVYFRGNLAESIAWPLLPLALWSMGRLARHGGAGWLAATALTYAAILLMHNVFALIFSPLLALYGLSAALAHTPPTQVRAQEGESSGRWRRLAQAGGALGLGLGLACFFWLPAMREQPYVHIDRLLVPPVFVYWGNFVTLGEIFTLPPPVSPDLLNPSPPRGLGLVPALLALPALLGARRLRGAGRRRQVVFFGAALAVYTFLMTAVSQLIWDVVPLLEFVQFPWRLLGPAALCLAMLSGAAVELLPAGRGGRWLYAGALAALILSALHWFSPTYCPGLERPTVADIAAFEAATGTIGTTAKGEYLPRSAVRFPPEPTPAPGRLAPETLPDSVRLIALDDRPLRVEATLETAVSQQIRVNLLDYPGWRAAVDGRAVEITPSPEFGLVTFPLPAGRHDVVIAFGPTPLRRLAGGVSLVSGFILIGLAVRGRRGWKTAVPPRPHPPPQNDHGRASPLLLGLLLFAVVHWLPLRLAPSNPLYRPGLAQPERPLQVDYDGGLRLLGYNSSARARPADAPGRYDLFWTAVVPPARAFQATLHLVGPGGLLWSAKESARPRDWRPAPDTAAWPPGRYALDSHLLAALPGTPPGVYDVEVILFDKETLRPARALGGQAPGVTLAQVELTRPHRAPDPEALAPQYPADVAWGPLRLVGFNLDRAAAAPGDPFLLTLFWQAAAAPGADWTARVTLQAPGGAPALQLDLPPVADHFPTSAWQAGDVWRGQHAFRLPAGLAGGLHEWRLALCPPANGTPCAGPAYALGALQVAHVDRLWEAPPLGIQLNERLDGVATLLGVLEAPAALAPGAPLPVTLVWRAEAETAASYAVFLHLLGPDGRVAAQSDGEPANWSRPTTGWLPGEIIVDARTLDVPPDLAPGVYTLLAGLYEPESGRRLSLADGETAVVITAYAQNP